MGKFSEVITFQSIGTGPFIDAVFNEISALNSNFKHTSDSEKGKFDCSFYGYKFLQGEYPENTNDTMTSIGMHAFYNGTAQRNGGNAAFAESGGRGASMARALGVTACVTDDFFYLSFANYDNLDIPRIIILGLKVSETTPDGFGILTSWIFNNDTDAAPSNWFVNVATGDVNCHMIDRLPYERTDTQTEIIPSKIITRGTNSTVVYNPTNIIDTTKLGMNSIYNIDGKIYYTVSPHTAILYNEK